MKKAITYFVIFIIILLSGCAQTLHIAYGPSTESTGTIHIRPTEATSQTLVTIDERLLIDKGYIKSVTVSGLPEGEHEIYYTSNSTMYKDKIEGKFTVNIPEDNEKTKIVQVPGYSSGYWAIIAIITIAVFIPTVIII